MDKACPVYEITQIKLSCHECGLKLACLQYEERLKDAIRWMWHTRTCGKKSALDDLRNIHINKTEMMKSNIWHWTSNEELLKDVSIDK